MATTFYNNHTDCEWLRGKLKPFNILNDFRSFVLEGSEDYPTAVVLYAEQDPLISAAGTRINFDDNGHATVIHAFRYAEPR